MRSYLNSSGANSFKSRRQVSHSCAVPGGRYRLYIQPPLFELFFSLSPFRTTPAAQEDATTGSSGSAAIRYTMFSGDGFSMKHIG